ncbi:TonB-dependent receptor plug domain-containing protein [Altererythrobacter lauratis]|uniref:TonB-dependent receptor plug domain-containing protein n=1 Tax=Alteraurantiacibacter lauratis TaxID=2054627 RepID=A0ABV7EF23_9SPHN
MRRYPRYAALVPTLLALSMAAIPAAAQNAPPEQEPIVVTGSALPVPAPRIGSSLTVIGNADITRRGDTDVIDLLRAVPGLAVSQPGGVGQLAQVRIRGAEGNHTLVLIDGIEVAPVGNGEFDFSTLLTGAIDRIEVLRGPQGGLYGSNALGGVINIVTRGGDGPAFAAAMEAGSFGTVMGHAATAIGNRETFLAATAQYRRTDGISAAAIGTERDGDRNASLNLRGGAALATGVRLDAMLRAVDKRTQTDGFDFSGGPLQGLAVDDESYSDTRDIAAGATLALAPMEGWDAALSASYSFGRLTGGADGADFFGDRGARLRISARSGYAFASSGGDAVHRITVFADYETERYRNTFPFAPEQIPVQRRSMAGLGAEYRVDLFDQVFLRASARHDDNEDFADATTVALTAAWQLPGTGTRLHSSFGTGVTNPTFTEQFGFNPGTFVGNPDLRPEKARGFDFGVEQRVADWLLVDATWFTATLRDEIVSLFPTVVNDAGRSRRHGVEVSGRMDLGWFGLAGSFTRLSARDPDGTREVRRPRHQASLDAHAQIGAGRIAVGAVYNGRMLDTDFRDFFVDFAATKTPLDRLVLLRLAGSLRVSDRLEVTARVENLLDETYQQAISYGAPGRAAYAGLRVVIP